MQDLYTTEGENLRGVPWEDYPRPQLRRKQWLCLNGTWSLRTDDGGEGLIRIPFCPESLLSQYGKPVKYGSTLRYERTFVLPKEWVGMRILLHFGAVSSHCEVFVNGQMVSEHANGYLSFSADITDNVLWNGKENVLEVFAVNDLSGQYPYGKQKIKRGGMWYTPVSGIWQTVWLEPVPLKHISRIQIRADARGADVWVEGAEGGEITCEGKTYALIDGKARIEPAVRKLWSPESPHLYEFTMQSGADLVSSYFALRSISVEERGGVPRLCLNGEPYFFHGLLDQGYFSDGIYTPATPDAYEQEIRTLKSLGFNTIRKHAKVEPERFYYDCDRLGMIVFQDMVNNGGYRFLRDTLLPNLHFVKRKDRNLHTDAKTRRAFLDGMEGTVSQLTSHPCILYWTIFNEGWGQFEADAAYERLKVLDVDRVIDATSGWFHQGKSDVDSLHTYFEKLHLGRQRHLPQVISEFGGYVYKIPEHSYNLEKTYGYKVFKTREDYAESIRRLYLNEVVPLAEKGLCASILTQASDVEDETNGLLTYDRKVCKLRPKDMEGITKALHGAVRSQG